MENIETILNLNGHWVSQIQMNRYLISLIFDNDVYISIFDQVDYLQTDATTQKWYFETNESFAINHLIEVPIKDINIDSCNHLIITFVNGDILKIYCRDNGESYSVSKGELLFVV